MSDPSAYVTSIQKLFPQGDAWPRANGTIFAKLIDALWTECQLINTSIEELLSESIITTATKTATLAQWEKLLGITAVAATFAGRREAIRAKLLAYANPRRQFSTQTFLDIAAAFAYSITVERRHPFYIGAGRMGDRLGGPEWASTVIVYVDAAYDAAFEAALRAVTPVHIQLNFRYV